MTPMVTITFNLATTDATAELGFEAWIDQRKFLDVDHVKEIQPVTVDVDDQDDGNEADGDVLHHVQHLSLGVLVQLEHLLKEAAA